MRLSNSCYNRASVFFIAIIFRACDFSRIYGLSFQRGSQTARQPWIRSEESMREPVCACVALEVLDMGRFFNTLKTLFLIVGALEAFCAVFWSWLELFPKPKVVAFSIFWQQLLINGSPSRCLENQCIEYMLSSKHNSFWSSPVLWSINVLYVKNGTCNSSWLLRSL